MPAILPETSEFRTPVYGTVFAKRSDVVQRLRPGAPLILVPDPPGIDDPSVWVHAAGGGVVGHLSPDLSAWLVPWLLAGHRGHAVVATVGGADVASWKRLIIEVRCQKRVADGKRKTEHGQTALRRHILPLWPRRRL